MVINDRNTLCFLSHLGSFYKIKVVHVGNDEQRVVLQFFQSLFCTDERIFQMRDAGSHFKARCQILVIFVTDNVESDPVDKSEARHSHTGRK